MWRIFSRLQRSFICFVAVLCALLLYFSFSFGATSLCSLRFFSLFFFSLFLFIVRNLLSVVSSSVRRAAPHYVPCRKNFIFILSVCLSADRYYCCRCCLYCISFLRFVERKKQQIICYFICCWFVCCCFFFRQICRELKTTTANRIYLHDHVNWTTHSSLVQCTFHTCSFHIFWYLLVIVWSALLLLLIRFVRSNIIKQNQTK